MENTMKKLKKRILICYQYRSLFFELVTKDIKLKYRRSFLGYLWSILNPLLTMLVLVVVFSNMFRFDIENFPVYLIIGQTLFTAMNEATTMAIWSITGNAALIKKVYVPKYIFTVSRVASSFVNFLFSLAAMVFVFSWCRVSINIYFFWIPVIIVQIFLFSLGLGLFLAQAAVFFRDIQYIYGVITTTWMYLTPIFYPLSQLPKWLQNGIRSYNPMYFYIQQFRCVVLEQRMPDVKWILFGFFAAGVALFIGFWSFERTQDRFILYI